MLHGRFAHRNALRCVRAAFALLLGGFAAAAAAGGDNPPDTGKADAATASPAPDAIRVGDLTFSGSIRTRLYVWNWFQPATGESQYEYPAALIRFGVSEKRNGWDWNAEFAAPILLGLPAGATDAAPQGALGLGSNYYGANGNHRNSAMIFPKQLFFRFDSLGGDARESLQLGRFTFNDGTEIAPKSATLVTLKSTRISQRLIGEFGFSDVGRSFDGVHYALATPASNFTIVGAVPTRGVFQSDGWGWNDVGFGYAAYTREWGSGKHAADTRFFVIEYDDWRPVLKTDNRALAIRKGDTENIRVETYGGHSIHAITTNSGALDLVAWGAVQTGRWGTQKQRAYAFDFEGGYQPKIWPRVKPWVRGGYTLGSGDGNASDNTHGTFFQLLPTPRPYARFPFFNMTNTEDAMGSLILRPHAKLTVSSEFHSLRLTNANDLWYSGGGVYQPWSFGYTGRATSGRRSLANLYDTSLEYRASRHFTATAYLGYAQGLAAMRLIYPQGTGGQFGYLEMLYKF